MWFFAELRRRGVLKIATAYLILCWLTLEVGHTLFQIFDLPHTVLKLIFALLALGLPVLVFITWHGRFGAAAQHGQRGRARDRKSDAHHDSMHEGPWLAAVFGAVAVLAIMVGIGVRFLGLPGEAHHGAAGEASPHVAAPAAAQAAYPSAAPVPEHSVAVLPFVNISEDRNNEYFSDGLTEELIDLLTRIPEMRVSARTSSFYFKGRQATIGDIASTLHVGHVLEGSVRKSGNALRITVQLVRADNGYHEYSQTFDRKLDDIFRVQDDIASAVVAQLTPALTGTPAASSRINVEAYNLYLQARYFTDRESTEDLDRAVALYERALAIEPAYAPAHAWLAQCYIRRVANGVDTNGVGYLKASVAAKRAIELDPKLAEGYVTLATAQMQYAPDWKNIVELVDKARALDPNNSLALQIAGHLAQAVGTLEEAEGYFRRGLEADPLNMLMRRYLGRTLYYQDRNDESEKELRQAIDLNPQFPALRYELARTLLSAGKIAQAVVAAESEQSPAFRGFALPLVYWSANRKPEAQVALARLAMNAAGSEFQVAECYAWFGDKGRALDWLEQARVKHDPGLIWLRRDPALRSLVADPRYAQLLQRTGLSR